MRNTGIGLSQHNSHSTIVTAQWTIVAAVLNFRPKSNYIAGGGWSLYRTLSFRQRRTESKRHLMGNLFGSAASTHPG